MSVEGRPIQGVVKFFNSEKGFGFIKLADGGRDVFVHARELRKSKVEGDLDEGDVLQFDTEETDRGLRAINIARVS